MSQETIELWYKVVDWTYQGCEEVGVVIFCDKHLGATIVHVEDTDRKLTCINGPSSPEYSYRETYLETFKALEEMIAKGKINGDRLDEIYFSGTGPGFGDLTCTIGG